MLLTKLAPMRSAARHMPLLCIPLHTARHTATVGASGASGRVGEDHRHSSLEGTLLHPPFIGSSSRFTYALPALDSDDIAALERETLNHHEPNCWNDYCCVSLVKLLRWCADKLFRERYIHRATMLKAIAPAPALAGAIVANLRMYLRKKDATYLPSHGNFSSEVRVLMAQMESHAAHVNILLSMCEITTVERVAAVLLYGLHYFIFTLLFFLYPRMAFRLMGYLNEESVVIWTHMINDVELGKIVERPIPRAALQYWGLHRFHHRQKQQSHTKSYVTEKEEEGRRVMHNNEASYANPSGDGAAENGGEDGDVSKRGLTLRYMLLLLRSDEMVWRDSCHAAADAIDEMHEVQ